MDGQALLELLTGLGPHVRTRALADRPAVSIAPERLVEVMERLHGDPQLDFRMLLSHTAIDYPAQNRIELVYLLYSLGSGLHLMVCCDLPRENPVAPSVARIWPIAHWQEREVFDMFGVRYENHTDLRRLFLEDDWQGFPLRKDYADPHMLERG